MDQQEMHDTITNDGSGRHEKPNSNLNRNAVDEVIVDQGEMASPSRPHHKSVISSDSYSLNHESPGNDAVGSNRPSPVISHQIPASLPRTQSSPKDGVDSRILTKGRFTVTPDTLPITPKLVERSASLNSTPGPVQIGRFTITPDTDVVQSDYTPTPIFVAGAAKVEKKGRFVVSSVVPPVLPMDSEHLKLLEIPSNVPIVLSTAPISIDAPSSAPANSTTPLIVTSNPVENTTNTSALSEEKHRISTSGPVRSGKPPVSSESKNIASTIGIGKIMHYLEQIKAEVSEADRNTKTLNKDVAILKEKNKDLEIKCRDWEKRWKDEKAMREAAEANVRSLKILLKEVQDKGFAEKLLIPATSESSMTRNSSRSSSFGEVDDSKGGILNYSNDIYAKTTSIEPNLGESVSKTTGGLRLSLESTAATSLPGHLRIPSFDSEKANPIVKTQTTTNSKPPISDSRHTRQRSSSQLAFTSNNTLNETQSDLMQSNHKRSASINGIGAFCAASTLSNGIQPQVPCLDILGISSASNSLLPSPQPSQSHQQFTPQSNNSTHLLIQPMPIKSQPQTNAEPPCLPQHPQTVSNSLSQTQSQLLLSYDSQMSSHVASQQVQGIHYATPYQTLQGVQSSQGTPAFMPSLPFEETGESKLQHAGLSISLKQLPGSINIHHNSVINQQQSQQINQKTVAQQAQNQASIHQNSAPQLKPHQQQTPAVAAKPTQQQAPSILTQQAIHIQQPRQQIDQKSVASQGHLLQHSPNLQQNLPLNPPQKQG
jgi:hypothetical protein